MNIYEKLQEQACKEGIDIIDYNFQSDRIKGLYCDGMVAISTKINTSIEKACVLAEEIATPLSKETFGRYMASSSPPQRAPIS